MNSQRLQIIAEYSYYPHSEMQLHQGVVLTRSRDDHAGMIGILQE